MKLTSFKSSANLIEKAFAWIRYYTAKFEKRLIALDGFAFVDEVDLEFECELKREHLWEDMKQVRVNMQDMCATRSSINAPSRLRGISTWTL